MQVIPQRYVQIPLAWAGVLLLGTFLAIHVWNDLSNPQPGWYFHSTPVWLLVMAVASAIYFRELSRLRRRGVDVAALFATLPPE